LINKTTLVAPEIQPHDSLKHYTASFTILV